jgi:AraC-like DNA-binding protein
MPESWVKAPEFVSDLWLNQIARDLQCLAGEVIWDDVSERPLSLVKVVDALPAPANPVQVVVLRGFLRESALQIGLALHDRAHPNGRVHCALNEVALMNDCFSRSGPDPRSGFAAWAISFCRELHLVHPLSKARRVAADVRRNFKQPLNVEKLARSVNITSSGLRKAFRVEFGRPLRNYHAAVRLLNAIGHVETAKVQGVALDVGYKSTKNFQRMFSSLTGFTPTAFRLLSDHDRREVMANAWKNVQLGKLKQRVR